MSKTIYNKFKGHMSIIKKELILYWIKSNMGSILYSRVLIYLQEMR